MARWTPEGEVSQKSDHTHPSIPSNVKNTSSHKLTFEKTLYMLIDFETCALQKFQC
jgi:hypothetical protein